MVALLPALATGEGFTVTMTVAVAEQPPLETVSVYVVVAVGVATGFWHVEQLRLADGAQEYVLPPLPFRVVFCPEQIVALLPALATGVALTVTTTGWVYV